MKTCGNEDCLVCAEAQGLSIGPGGYVQPTEMQRIEHKLDILLDVDMTTWSYRMLHNNIFPRFSEQQNRAFNDSIIGSA